MLIEKDELSDKIREIETQCTKSTSVEKYMEAVRNLIDGMAPAYDTSMVITLVQALKHPYHDFPENFSQERIIDFYLEKAIRIIATGGMNKGFNASYENRIKDMIEYRKDCREAYERLQQTQTRG